MFRFQNDTHLEIGGIGKNLKEKSVALTCTGGHFLMTIPNSKRTKRIQVEKATCSRKQEPRLVRSQEQCSPVGTDGRAGDLETLVRVSLGWQFQDTFIKQIELCVDESNFGTLWSRHTVHGASIAFRDKNDRPGFRVDTSKNKRLQILVGYTFLFLRFFKGFTSSKMYKLYDKDNQLDVLTSTLGGVTTFNGEEIIDTSKTSTDFLAKGHLSPDAAFVYEVEEDATYFFFNTAPQVTYRSI